MTQGTEGLEGERNARGEREETSITIAPGETIDLGGGIVVSLVSVKGGAARIGVEAPADVRILREEIARPASRTRVRRMRSFGWPSRLRPAGRGCGSSSGRYLRALDARKASGCRRIREWICLGGLACVLGRQDEIDRRQHEERE